VVHRLCPRSAERDRPSRESQISGRPSPSPAPIQLERPTSSHASMAARLPLRSGSVNLRSVHNHTKTRQGRSNFGPWADASGLDHRFVTKTQRKILKIDFLRIALESEIPRSDLGIYIPLQRAIIFLFEDSWRVRFCAECNKRFVAAQPMNRFCADECRMNNRTRQKLEWRRKHSKDWRNRLCAECTKPFVAAEPKSKFCCDTCSHINRKVQKRKCFRKHGKQRRRKARRRK
jgi:hypothetical protein